MKKRTRIRFGIAIFAVIVVGVGIAVSVARLRGPESNLPTTKVVRGNVDPKVYANGELRTPNSALLMAPPVGGTLQIVTLAKTGAMVKPGDIVLEFDPSEQEYNLEQANSQLLMAEQQITKTKDDGAVSSANDQVALLHARYDVRRAELDVSQNELKSAIDAKKNDLALEEAHRRLAQLEQDVQSRTASNQANLAVYVAQRTKAQLDIKQARGPHCEHDDPRYDFRIIFPQRKSGRRGRILFYRNDSARISGRRSNISRAHHWTNS